MMMFEGRNRVTSPFGSTNTRRNHGGIDIVGDDNRNVYAVKAGKADLVQYWDGKTKTGSQSYGNLVRVATSDGEYMYYAHLASTPIKRGDKITAGQFIGVMGSTGNSTGPHTHFEVRRGGLSTANRVNPAPYCGVENKKGTYAETKPPTVNYYPTCNYSGISIVDALKSIGVAASFGNRKKIAVVNGITNYFGSAAQNTKMLKLLKAGKLKKA